jgi:peptidylprolyl isomerase
MANPEDTMVLETTQGKVVIAMRPDLAPGHVARIKELVREGFYDGIVFHRVIDGFMAQTGCPHGTGTGGSGKKLKAEFNREPHRRGTVSMARAQNPDSGDSQFFICFDDAAFLNGQYTVWGEVIEGMENVDKIKRGEPVQNPDKIVSAKMADQEARSCALRLTPLRAVQVVSVGLRRRRPTRPVRTTRAWCCRAGIGRARRTPASR